MVTNLLGSIVRVHWIFDFTVRLTNRTSDPCGGFLGGIVKCPEEIAVGVDAMSGLITASFECCGLFVSLFVTYEEP